MSKIIQKIPTEYELRWLRRMWKACAPVNKELARLTYLAINAAVTRRLLVNTTGRSISYICEPSWHLSLNLVLLYKCRGRSQNSLISFARFKFCKSSFVVISFALITLPYWCLIDFLRVIARHWIEFERDIISLWQARVVRLGRTIAFYQVFFQQGRVALSKWGIGPQKGHLRTPGMEFFV